MTNADIWVSVTNAVGTGTLVGYLSHMAKNGSRRYLLDRQRKHEQGERGRRKREERRNYSTLTSCFMCINFCPTQKALVIVHLLECTVHAHPHTHAHTHACTLTHIHARTHTHAELLGLPPPLQQKDLDTVYLHELLRIHQKKLVCIKGEGGGGLMHPVKSRVCWCVTQHT